MSMQSISKSLFSLTSLNEKAYQLDIQFLDEDGDLISKKNITFIQQKSTDPGETLDVYSQNGVCCDPILKLFTSKGTSLFKSHDEQGVIAAAKKMAMVKPLGPSVLVLDMKDQKKSYLDQGAIVEAEETFCDFLKQENLDSGFLTRTKKVHELFQKALPVDFVLCEGALKSDLLKSFSETEAAYFLKTQAGAIDFCQCAEFYMNGFKLGQEAKGIPTESYFQPVSSRMNVFKPQSKSTVWYPAAYKEIYSLNGDFAQTLKPVFSVSGDYDEASQITSMSVEMRS